MIVEQNKELIEKFNKLFIERNGECVNKDTTLRPFFVYAALYGHTPRLNYLGDVVKRGGTFKFIRGDNKDGEMTRYVPTEANYSFYDTCDKLGVIVYPTKISALYITDMGIIQLISYGFRGRSRIYALDAIDILTDNEESKKMLEETVMEALVEGAFENEETSNKVKYQWLKYHNTAGLLTDTLEFDKVEVDLDKNYNDDLPYDRIKELLASDSSELILFNGKPGTGKTTLIKKLMSDLNDKTFIYVNTSFLINVNTTSFIDFLLNRKNCVVVLEDCEKILLEREQGNPFMEALLNLTDGIIGDSVKPKFVCSFNCSENKIDKALLRLGRLSLKYTFNELSLEKTRRIIPEATKALTLADIYNYDTSNMVGACSSSGRIGFTNS